MSKPNDDNKDEPTGRLSVPAMDRVWKGLLDSEQKYHLLVEKSLQGIVILQGSPPRIVYANQTIAEMIGLTVDVLCAMPAEKFMSIVLPEDRDGRLGAYGEKLVGEIVGEHYEIRVQRPDGAMMWLEIFSRFSEYREQPAVQVMVLDITKRKNAEQALVESESKYRALAEQSLQGIVIGQGEPIPHIVFVNRALAEMVGYGIEQLEAMDAAQVRDLIHPDDQERFFGEYIARLGGKKDMELFEFRIVSSDGSVKWIELYPSTLEFDGQPAVQAIILDVSLRKEAERRLVESEKFNRMMLRSIRDGVYKLDTDGRFTYVNEIIVKRSGHSEQWFLEHGFLDVIRPEDHDVVRENFEAVMNGRIPAPYELAYPAASGEMIWVEVNTTPHREAGEVVGLLGVSRDITGRKKAERERRTLEHRMQQAQRLESLGVLAGGIAHDFNNLLMVVQGNAEMAKKAIARKQHPDLFIEEITLASRSAADLCQQMLAYSGKGKFNVAPVSLNQVVREVLDLFEVSLGKKARLVTSLDPALPAISADATQIQQVLMNLVMNAAEAMGTNGGTVTVSTGKVDCDGEYLRDAAITEELTEGMYAYLEVDDDGQGMDPEILDRIFNPFFTTKFTGRGLGLAASLGIVRGHCGALKVSSQPDNGSTFTALFPALDAPASVLEAWVGDDAEWRGSGKLLLVDDDPRVRSVARLWLEEMGFDVLEAQDGAEAVEQFESHGSQIACVLLDLVMPKMDGVTAYRRIREMQPAVPVIFSSGYNETEVNVRLEGEDIEGFLHKPYRSQELRDALRAVMGTTG